MPVLRLERLSLPPHVPPWRVLAAVAVDNGAFWLDSADELPGLGRWSFAGLAPVEVVRVEAGEGASAGGDRDAGTTTGGIERLDEALERLRDGLAPAEWRAHRRALGVPFCGGAVGALAYDFGSRLERVRLSQTPARRDSDFPDLAFGIYTHVVVHDALTGAVSVAGTARGFSDALATVAAEVLRLSERSRAAPREDAPLNRGREAGELSSSFSPAGYRGAVRTAIRRIRAGDLFEVNLSQRFCGRLREGAFATYLRLREVAAAPFCAYLQIDENRAILSASPERFLALRGGRIEARPIKGTRPRGTSEAEDAALARALCASRKDRAELAMIVDLMRNDLGRVAAPGSVQVADPAELVRFRTVHHLVGHVVGHMDQGAGWVDLVRAAFPPGSITGAPKALAMEVIDELEPVRRSIYTGAIGYVSADGDLDFNVAIRTLLVDRERVTFGVGGAVTARSDPDAEYEETLVKGRALARALGASVDCVEAAPGSGGRAAAVIT